MMKNEDKYSPYAPKRLTKVGQKYWRVYIRQIKQTPVNLLILEDLCYWEERKEEAKKELKKAGTDILIYRDDLGKIRHTQPLAMIYILKTAQDKINSLREKLFGPVEKANDKTKPKSRARSFENYTKIRKLNS